MPGQSFASSIYHSIKRGCIDITFSPHYQNANKLLSIRDKNNSISDHIGNIKLGPINFKNLTADISYFIGERKHWGKGLATQAISEIIKIAKSKFKLKKLQAGHWKKNLGSKKVLKRNNFKLEGILRSQIVVRNKRYDRYLYGLLI